MEDLLLKTSSYDYNLPQDLIATKPIIPSTTNSKLLVYERSKNRITHTHFYNILDFIPKNTEIFINNSKVIKARIFGKKNRL